MTHLVLAVALTCTSRLRCRQRDELLSVVPFRSLPGTMIRFERTLLPEATPLVSRITKQLTN